jgi:ribose transport system substrate-binding protein
MSGKQIAFWALALAAIAAAVWYNLQVFQPKRSTETPSLVLITSGSGPYWQLTANGARAAAKAHRVNLEVKMPKMSENLEQQMLFLAEIDRDKLGGVAFSPIDPEAQTRLINEMAHETYVVTLDSDAPLSERHCHIGTSNIDAGRLCAELVAEALPEGGKVALLLANLTKSSGVDRKHAFEESLGRPKPGAPPQPDAPKFEIVGTLVDDGDDEKCRQLIRETLQQHPDLAGFVALNARHGPLLLEVLKAEDKLGKIKLITFDEPKEVLDGLEAGHVFATVAQDPYMYGYESIRRLSSLCRGDRSDLPIVGGGTIHVNAEAIRKENLEKFREKLRERLPKEK